MSKNRFTGRALRRVVAGLLLTVVLPVGPLACFGKFQLVRNVHTFNHDLSPDPWMRWLVFLIPLSPIYALATIIDLFLTNPIEFWSGENPVQPQPKRQVVTSDGSVVTLTQVEPRRVQVSILSPDGTLHRVDLAREGQELVARDVEGRVLARRLASR